ncbi:alpha/beta fold hydrolase [Verrucosispora sp. WMMA2044]|uniref:alpha/beta hydrolase family protein n=1 Tax=Verrucosispora sp. WMMA2044 TaxID=3016419 RepID=UPI00248D3335|nr:alpha/beta fold hydrolase [Verrucosispora sp. WMMA2044]WBB50314.1 alpha/beta fold hydrolase [Verrucosispora sp. WMMA2044]
MRKQTVEIEAAGALLAGTLTRPDVDGRRPAALLVNGSGPIDRDSAMPGLALGLGPALAVALADEDCVVLRYDKRGVGSSQGDYLGAGFHDECRDAAAALAALRAHPAVDSERVFVVGHSTGAVVAANLVRAVRPPAGYVLLAGAAQPGDQVMAWQSERIAATLPRLLRPLGPVLVRRQARERDRIRRSTADRHDRMPRSRLTDRWLREYLAHDPRPDLAAIDRPVLAITGGKDVQVDPADVPRIGRLVTGQFDGELPTDLTHLLRRDCGPPGLWRYRGQLRRPIDDWVIRRVVAWARIRLAN